jgi:beta-lactam-binding protein with PASTA domain
VPSVIGLSQEVATARLKKGGLKVDVTEGVGFGDAPCTKVVEQDPIARTLWDPKQPVAIVVEVCPETTAEPSSEPTTEPTSKPVLAFPAPPSGKVGSPYRVTLTVKGGTEPYAWAVGTGSPPPGLDLKATGLLSGTPTKAGSYSFTAQVTDADDLSATQKITLVITPRPTLPPTPVLKKVPSVKGLPQKEAEGRLAAAGLKVTVANADGGAQSPCMEVVEQNPPAGTMLDSKKPVEISVIAKACPPSATPTPTATS